MNLAATNRKVRQTAWEIKIRGCIMANFNLIGFRH